MTFDSVERPAHYAEGRKYETIDVIEDWRLSYRLGNCVKYVSRAGRKDPAKTIEDLRKAQWYLNREIEALEGVKTPYAVTYEDVLEDYAACAAEGAEPRMSLDEVYDAWEALDNQQDLWDPTLGPVEPTQAVPDPVSKWGDFLAGQFCEVDLDELHKDLDQFENDEIISTFERRGLIFGVDKLGKTYVLGTTEVSQ
jgi:hypothetical protein